MHQEQSLNMNLSQHLAMTMKLQQAIQILQLSAQDLKAEIEKEYLENPALEMEYGDGADTRQMENLRAENISALAEYLEGDGNSSNGGYPMAALATPVPANTFLNRLRRSVRPWSGNYWSRLNLPFRRKKIWPLRPSSSARLTIGAI